MHASCYAQLPYDVIMDFNMAIDRTNGARKFNAMSIYFGIPIV